MSRAIVALWVLGAASMARAQAPAAAATGTVLLEEARPRSPQAEPPLADPLADPLARPGSQERSVLLFAADGPRAEWTAALQVELGPRAVTVVPAPLPEGATALIRDAGAQTVLRERGSESAFVIEEGEVSHSIRLLTPDAPAARVARVSSEADPRTAALIAVSLWDESLASPDAPPRPRSLRHAPAQPDRPSDERATAILDTSGADAPDAEPGREPNSLVPSLRFGTGVFSFLNNRRGYVGTLLRAGGALQYGIGEFAVFLEGGPMLEHVDGSGGHVHPMVRGCVDPGFATLDDIAFHGGIRVCGGYAAARDNGGSFTNLVLEGWLLDIGGHVAVSVLAKPGLRVFVRADLGAGWLEAAGGVLRASATLSAMVSVE